MDGLCVGAGVGHFGVGREGLVDYETRIGDDGEFNASEEFGALSFSDECH